MTVRLTALVELPLEQLSHGFRVFPAICVVSDDITEIVQSSLEGFEIGFVVDGGFIHVFQYLLRD